MKKNTIEIIDQIKYEFSNYVYSTFTIEEKEYEEKLKEKLARESFFNGPYLHTVLPFMTTKCISELIVDDVFDREIRKLNLDIHRPLYQHQLNAALQINRKNNVVITTGTGSGKTESFLYPILNHIIKEKKRKNSKGIKAILLYPMNALVNDQKERLQDLLKNYPDITFASYTGDTPEDEKALRKLYDEEKVPFLANEIRTREEIRKNPPDILFTNYSMMEYLLIRPNDYSLLCPENMRNFQFFVLDEAHTYKGTLAIEISYLLKRFQGYTNREPQFILTSATLGDKNTINDIIQFAQNLTTSKFNKEGIIFGIRKPLYEPQKKIQIQNSDYTEMAQSIDDINELKQITSKYGLEFTEKKDSQEIIYDLLVHDPKVYDLFHCIDGIEKFEVVKEKMNKLHYLNKEQLVALIHLSSLAKSGSQTLYDTKFHLFVSVPQKACITLGKTKDIRFGNYKSINNERAFEIGYCKNCHHIFVIGKIKDGYLVTDDTVDIYENYGTSEKETMDFFVLDLENINEEEVIPYYVCTQCGRIYEEGEVNPKLCDCEEEEYIKIYRIVRSDTGMKNNLNKCPYCDSTSSQSGIVQSFKLNKDQGTAVLAQIFYDSMGNTTKNLKSNSKKTASLFEMPIENEDSSKGFTKQLLAFSDSRQQASFFSIKLTDHHERFLRKRMVWDEVEKKTGINIRTLSNRIKNRIIREELIEQPNKKAQSEAWVAVLQDLLFSDGKFSAEGIGLYVYEYDYMAQLSQLKDSEQEIQQRFGLTVEEMISLINLTIVRLRKERAIDYQIAELSDQEKKDAFPYMDQEKFLRLKKEEKSGEKYITSFLPVKEGSTNKTIDFLQKIIPNKSKKEYLELGKSLFALIRNLKILESVDQINGYQLNVERFNLKPYYDYKWYKCDKCQKVTVYNIRGICPEKNCNGHLVECDVDEVFKSDYYRNKYMGKKVEKVIAREHTGQIERKRAKSYQEEFKNKKINILSSSTTFEMGVDLGTLEYVFLRNVPPTPANYIQRAGRAGRSKDASALVITYCGNNSHDYFYFSRPKSMIAGTVKPPKFKVDNSKIMIRHILASAFSYFFRDNPEYFKDMDFVYKMQCEPFKEYLLKHPKSLGEYIDHWVLKNTELNEYKNFKWINVLLEDESILSRFINEMTDKIQIFQQAEQDSIKNGEYDLAKYFQYQITALSRESMVSLLSENAVIPKYGFPVDIVSLNVIGRMGKNTELDLTRSMMVAISEYAPDSEVVADGNKYVSRYINLPRRYGGLLPRRYYYACDHCHETMVSLEPFKETDFCKSCGQNIQKKNQYFLIPDLGFSSLISEKRSKTTRPIKTYASEIKYLGGGKIDQEMAMLNGKIVLTPIVEDQLAVINDPGFYYCPQCGYAKKDHKNFRPVINEKKTHRTSFGSECLNKRLERISLGYVFYTDVIRLQLQLTKPLEREEAITFVYGVLEGMAKFLQIEIGDINGVITRNSNGEYDLILFDQVAGGAGYVRQLANEEILIQVLQTALKIVSGDCCEEETTCYSCLRSYYNQSYHDIMKKKYVKKIIEELLES